jgi:hypothetical protein
MAGRHMQDDVSAEEQQLLLAFPPFQDIYFVEGSGMCIADPTFFMPDFGCKCIKEINILTPKNGY